jgi:hypothetical protein
MKGYLKICLPLFIAFAICIPASKTQAQVNLISPTYGLAKDTVTNTATKVLWKQVTGFKETIVVVTSLTKISGTLGGKVVPIASLDGTTFIDVSSASKDTLTVADAASQVKGYVMPKGYQYYGVQWTGTGTMSGSFTGKLLARKPTD